MKKNCFWKCLLLVLAVASATHPAQAQQRDRRADLNLSCYREYAVSQSGRLWIATACGKICTADNIHSSWREVKDQGEYGRFEKIATFDDKTAVFAGFLSPGYNYVARTTSSGMFVDTVVFDNKDHWVRALYCDESGRIWMGSALGRNSGAVIYSDDKGASFRVLNRHMPRNSGIEFITMVDADSGMAGTYHNQIVTTSDNWKTVHLMPTPFDQLVHDTSIHIDDLWVTRIQPWNGCIIVTQMLGSIRSGTFYSACDSIQWHRMPFELSGYMVDRTTGWLWGIADSSRLICLKDFDNRRIYPVSVVDIIGFASGHVYCTSPDGVLRIDTAGRIDTCGFYTEDRPIEESEWGWKKVAQGERLWASDGISIYILDEVGWYRICRLTGVESIKPAPDSSDRIVVSRTNGGVIAVDTSGRMEAYRYKDPIRGFVEKGIKSVEIKTFRGGCFHYDFNVVSYKRQNDDLVEKSNNVDSVRMGRSFAAKTVEKALLSFSQNFDRNPTASDFGIEDTTIDVNAILKEPDYGWSTSYYGYKLTFVNNAGDTLRVGGSTSIGNDFKDRTRFPWMLPMTVDCNNAHFVSYQPCLWQALKPMMPTGMLHRNYLDNSSLRPHFKPQSGDLFFVRGGNSDMEKAISASTGNYTHVAMVECDSAGRLFVIEATTGKGVRRLTYGDWNLYSGDKFDVYRLTVAFDTAAVIERAKSFVGQPYDESFLPDNGALYCSELIYEAYLDSVGNHLFQSKPMVFRNKKGRMPRYWKRHFRKLGIPIPENVPGTNPTDMSQSPLLIKVF